MQHVGLIEVLSFAVFCKKKWHTVGFYIGKSFHLKLVYGNIIRTSCSPSTFDIYTDRRSMMNSNWMTENASSNHYKSHDMASEHYGHNQRSGHQEDYSYQEDYQWSDLLERILT